MLWFFSFILIPLINSDDPCNINSESIGSNFINLDPSVSTFENDILTLGLTVPTRYNISSITFEGARFNPETNQTISNYIPGLESFWEIDTTSDPCLVKPFFTSTYADIKLNQPFTFSLLDEDDKYYFVNRIKLIVTEPLPMVPHFKLNFTRTIELEIPWLFVLEKEVELEVEMDLWKYSDPPSTVPTASPSAAPVMQPTVSPSLAPTPLVMDHLFTYYAVVRPALHQPSRVAIDFETVVRAPYHVLSDTLEIHDSEGVIIDGSNSFSTIQDCSLLGYDTFTGFCITDIGQYSAALYASAPGSLCETICDALEECLAYDVYATGTGSFCEVIGPLIKPDLVDQYPDLFQQPDTDWQHYRGLPDGIPVRGNGLVGATCNIKSETPVWETSACTEYEGERPPDRCYCRQQFRLEYDSDALCQVYGGWVLSMQIGAEFMVNTLPYETMVSIVSQLCAEIVGAIEVEGTMSIGEEENQYGKYYIGEVLDLNIAFSTGVEMQEFELEYLQWEQFIEGEGSSGRRDSFNHTVRMQEMGLNNLTGSMIVDFAITDPEIKAARKGVRTNIFAAVSILYQHLQTRRRRLIFTSENGGKSLAMQRSVLIYPRKCSNPDGKAGQHFITKCGKGKIVQTCSDLGEWQTLVNQCNGYRSWSAYVFGTSTGWWEVFDVSSRVIIISGIIFLIWKSRKTLQARHKRLL